MGKAGEMAGLGGGNDGGGGGGVVTQPHGEVASLQLAGHQGVELERRPQSGALLFAEMNLELALVCAVDADHLGLK